MAYDVLAAAQAHGGMLSRRQLLSLGVSDGVIRRMVTAGHWRRMHRGLYLVLPGDADVVRQARAAIDAVGRQPRGRAYPAADAQTVVSGLLAARLHGLPVLDESFVPEVSVPPGHGARTRKTLVVRRRRLATADVVRVHGVPTTSLLRTVLDMVQHQSREQALVVLDQAARSRWLRLPLPDGVGLSRRARAVVALAEPASESPLETLIRLLLHDAGIDAEVQVVIRDVAGVPVARVDLYLAAARVAIEADGADPHTQPAALYRDRGRQNELQNLGIRVLRFTWYDVTRRPAYVVATVRAAISQAA